MKQTRPPAETLAEVIIAFLVIGIIGTAATMVLTQSIDANKEAEERLVAYNLAREGVEAIRNLRDTNWLRFPGDHANCWDVMPDTTSSLNCTTATKIGSATGEDYLVYPELADATRFFAWNFYPIDPSTDDTTVWQLTVGAASTPILSTEPDCWTSTCPETPYHRSVTVVSEDLDGDLLADTLTVISTVTWESNGAPRTITFADKLINY